MKTFVLCGGEGTRLRPYTYSMPKPMLTVGGKPILQYMIENLKANGLTDLILTVGYMKEEIMKYLGDGKRFGVNIEYAVEETPMNTAGSILPYKGKINETFVVVMGDQLTNINMRRLIDHHKKNRAIATVAVQKKGTTLEYGVVQIENGMIKHFAEKPMYENYINTAIYVLEPKIFDYIGEKEDFAKHVFPKLLKAKERINAYVFDEPWFDIGRVSDYERLNELFTVVRLMNVLSK